MVEQTFRSPGFFEREIDLSARRQTTSGIPGGVVGTSMKGPAFVPVTVGDFTDFINRFGNLHPDRPAVYAAFEFLKNKRALTFMRVLGAGGNSTPADRDSTRTAGVVKGAGFRIHGAADSATLRVERSVAPYYAAVANSARVHGGVYLITANHDLTVVGGSAAALVTYPIFTDNPSVTSATSTQLLRGVVYTTSDYRMTACGVNDSYTFTQSWNPTSDDKKASLMLRGATAEAGFTYGDTITLIDWELTSHSYIVVDNNLSELNITANTQTALTNGVALTANSRINGVQANVDDAIIAANASVTDIMRFTVPASAGGSGTAVDIRVVANGALPGTNADNFISIELQGATVRERIIDAINGVAHATIEYANTNGVAGTGVQGLKAEPASAAGKVKLVIERPGDHVVGVTNQATDGDAMVANPAADYLQNGSYTATVHTGKRAVVITADTDAIPVYLAALKAAIAVAHAGKITSGNVTADGIGGAGNSWIILTQSSDVDEGNTTVTLTQDDGNAGFAELSVMSADGSANATNKFEGGLGDDHLGDVLRTSGLAAITDSEFNLVIVENDADHTVLRTIKASLDPEHPSYISKVLNTDPHKFKTANHLLYLDLPVEDEVAPATEVFVASPSSQEISDSPFADSSDHAKVWSTMGRMDTRYTTATTPAIISQPFGTQEFDIMTFESLSDGAAGNGEVKISIANIKASLDDANPYGTFEIQVRNFRDLDSDPEIVESYPGCTLDPDSESFVARVIGDYNTYYNFDADEDEERRLIVRGKYPNRSLRVRVKMSDMFERGELPKDALPFGFRGIPVMKVSESLTDDAQVTIKKDGAPLGKTVTDANLLTGDTTRVNTKLSEDQTAGTLKRLASPIFPPLPMRFKITRGKMKSAIVGGAPTGDPELTEKVDPKLYWGMKPERLPRTGSVDNSVLNPNAGGIFNELLTGYTKFQGISKTGALLSGSAIDSSNANKFTLARVALNATGSSASNIAEHVTGSAREHMLEAVYMRDAVVDGSVYTIHDPGIQPPHGGTRVTMATLLASSSVKFNRFTAYNKFTLPLFGGFDGLNILDKDMHLMNDRSASTDAPSGFYGKASTEFSNEFTEQTGLHSTSAPGIGSKNSTIMTYKQAIIIMTDAMTVRHNILAVPGIRDSFITDFAAERIKSFSLAFYLMDIPAYSQDMTRLFGTEDRSAIGTLSSTSPDIRETAEQFSSRVVDNSYSAAYFPDVVLVDEINETNVAVPASVAAMKALSFSDSVSFPWFAPAGFNRGALDNVTNVDVRLTAGDRDELYDARINPIANFPNGGFVIFGQKTLQLAKSALDRVNVRRMLLEVKRLISRVAERLLFEPNNAETRARFINLVTPLLAAVQAQAGIDSFQVVMDDTNNADEDVENNRLNGRIVVVPTRAIEFIAIDFIITNSGVSFE